MSQHPSLGSSRVGSAHRSVLKRYERVKVLLDKKLWNEGDSVQGLPKVKILKIKVRKEKAAAEEKTAAAGTTPAAAPAAGGKSAAAKEATPKGK